MYFLLLAISSSFLISEDISGYDLAKMIDEKKQPKTSKSEISMTLMDISKNRNKTKNIISISKDDGDKMLMFFKSPKRDKGVSFLKIESDNKDKLSLFIPKLKKIRRISSNNQSDSFMGSDLSFEDMLSRDLEDFDYKIIDLEDETMYLLESISKDSESEYSRHLSWITKQDLLIKKEQSFDKNGNLLKEKFFSQTFKKNYHLISKIDVTNLQENHRTVLEINNLEIDNSIDDDVFQEKNLKRFEKFVK